MTERETAIVGVPDDCEVIEESQPIYRGRDGFFEASRFLVCAREDCTLLYGLGVEGKGRTEKTAIKHVEGEIRKALDRGCVVLRNISEATEE